MESVVGPEHVLTDSAALSAYEVDGATPSLTVRPADAAQAREVVRIAIDANLKVIPYGARTSLQIGMPPTQLDLALDMTRVSGVAHYDPGDLTISVNAGTPLSTLEKALSENRQFLPLAVPFFSAATVGGAVASGLDSPLRHFYGTARDFLIGAEFIDGTGALTKSGGRVVKNVTGYDFHKLLHGSLGTLTVITRLNFRTYPLPPSRRGFLASFTDESGALLFSNEMARSALTPVVCEILSPEFAKSFLQENSPVESLGLDSDVWTVCVGFEGGPEVCDRYARDLSRIAQITSAQNAAAIHDSVFSGVLQLLREAPAFMKQAASQAVVFRFAALPAQVPNLLRALRSFAESSWIPSVSLIRSGTIIYFALLPKANDDSAARQSGYFWKSVGSLRDKFDFNASILFCPAEWKRQLNVWAYAPADLDLHRRVKNAFDSMATFAPGRFAGGI
jgi:glycolate oxidase FAD binding subunit